MGAWGAGSFDNDDASDFLVRLEDEGADAVRDALREVTGLDAQDYCQIDSAASAVAAAEIVAAALDGDVSRLPQAAQDRLAEYRDGLASDAIAALARRAMDRVLMRSELKDLWQEGGPGASASEWENGVRALAGRLGTKAAKVPKRKAAKKPGGRKTGFEPGTVLRVDLDAQWHVYARMLEREPKFAFYDCRVSTAEDPLEIVKRPVLFVLAVSSKSRDWLKIGHVPLEAAPVPIPEVFLQDAFSGACQITDVFSNARPATASECVGLERCAIWSPVHVQKRLLDHYAGQPNGFVEILKVKLDGGSRAE